MSAPPPGPGPEPKHRHEWQPNGTVELDREACSPVSRWDDILWVEVASIAVCKCGVTKRTWVGERNKRRRGDDLRRGR